MSKTRPHFYLFLKKYLLAASFLFAGIFLFLWIWHPDETFNTRIFLSIDVFTLTGFFTSVDLLNYQEGFSWLFLILPEVTAFIHLYFLSRFFQSFFSSEYRDNFWNAGLVKEIAWYFVFFQLVIFFMIFYAVSGNVVFDNLFHKIYFALAYAIGSLTTFRIDLLSHLQFTEGSLLIFNLIISGATYLGLLGFFVLKDLIYPASLRYRLAHPQANWKLYTRIALFGSFILFFLCGLGIYLLEADKVFKDYPLMDELFSGFIWALNAQFGGLENKLLAQFTASTLVILLAVMFAGGAMTSLSGGVKFSSFFLLSKEGFFIKMIVYLAALPLFLAFFAFIFNNGNYLHSLFLQFSAFFNVGWSVEQFSTGGGALWWLSLLMFTGRLLTFLVPVMMIVKTKAGKLPEELFF